MHKNRQYLIQRIREKKNFLCVGLDPDIDKIPESYRSNNEPLFSYCKTIIEESQDFAIAYKINVAFFERQGSEGWRQLEKLVRCIPSECLIIADAKRADIGNTSSQYAQYYFDVLGVDAVTLHPYMGIDSLEPFLRYKNKWSIILALTSNPGSDDFEKLKTESGQYLFEKVISSFNQTEFQDNIMYVVGATQPKWMSEIRSIAKDSFLLIPGVGEQGGDLESTIHRLRIQDEGILINVSRKIMYPNGNQTTREDIRKAVLEYHQIMNQYF